MNKLLNIRKLLCIITLIGIVAMSCAPAARNVMASSVSPVLYVNLECDMLIMELASVESKVAQLTSMQRKVRGSDAAVIVVGVLLLWPVLFALSGITGKNRADELARAKGEKDAINKAIMMKGGCGSDGKPDDESAIYH